MITNDRPLVVIESPFSAPTDKEITRNVYYAMLAVRDSLGKGEAPYASHLFFTQLLDDSLENERILGIDAGLAVTANAKSTIIYADLGISTGMQYGMEVAERLNRKIIKRYLFNKSLSINDMEKLIFNTSEQLGLPRPAAVKAIYIK